MKFLYLFRLLVIVCLFVGLTGCDLDQNEKTKPLATSKTEPEARDNPQQRLEAEFNMVKDPVTGQIPKGVREVEMREAYSTPIFPMSGDELDKALPNITITSKGPNNYGGRTRALGFDVRNSNIVIAGGVSGGIFRTTDGGGDWTRVTPAGELHNLSTVAQDTRSGNQDTWYAGTGEQTGNSASAEGGMFYGHGILKSTNNGASWTPLMSTRSNNSLEDFDSDFDYISKILVNPNNGDVLVSVGEAVLRSADGGQSWSPVLGQQADQGLTGDLIYNSSSNTFYAAINGQDSNGGIHSSTDGINWTQIRSATDLDANGVGRIVISNLGATAGIAAFYQLNSPVNCTNGEQSEAGLQVFTNGIWTNHTDKVGNCNNGSAPTKQLALQGSYNMCMISKPDDANLIYFGGTEIYRYNISTEVYDFIGGSQAGANTVNLHVDNHILLFDPNDSKVLWSGNDGGLRTTDVTGIIKTNAGDDNGYTWSSKNNNYVTYQYYGADINPLSGSQFVAGAAQDNAFSIQPTTAEALEVGPTVDGTSVSIISGTSFTNYSVLTSWQNGGLVRIDNGTQTDIQPIGQEQGFISRIYLDADNTQILYYPTKTGGLLRTTNASGIANGSITGNAGSGWEEMTGVSLGAAISTFETSRNAAGTSNGSYNATDASRQLYLGTEGGLVHRLSDPAYGNAAAAPVNITPSGSSGFVSDIAINPENDKEVMVTYSNYNVSSIWHTTDASVASPNWSQIEGANGAVTVASIRSALIVKTSTQVIYLVGTSTGLYGTDVLAGTNTVWERVGNMNDIGLAIGSFMRLRPSDNQAVLATHGNGLFLLGFPQATVPVELTSFTGSPAGKGNILNWITSEEVDNSGFDVEKSVDGQNFERIAYIPAAQSRSSNSHYEYFDAPLTNEVTYYRLRQIDIDGSFEHSEIINVRNGTTVETRISLFPNPVVDKLTVVNGQGEAMVLNAIGQQVAQVTITSPKQDLIVSELPKGAYVLTIKNSGGELVTCKFIKQ